ncbi:MAG TPA: fibronectin type III domain-containing protein [Vicinamibacterales bacterium]|nr:fibronectin type III domain-containing protein [Vicinamibacterales bacterium]
MIAIRTGSLVVLVGVGLTVALTAQQPPAAPPAGTRGAAVVAALKHDTSPALRDIPPLGVDREGGRTVHEPLPVPKRRGSKVPWRDPAAQDAAVVPLIPAPTVNFDGISNLSGVLPPDTNGDVGPNHYVQWINLKFAIWNKSGALLYGPADGRTLFAGFGGPCESSNNGDPIVLYDEAADRWMLSQFALPNYPSGPFYQCIAVSTGGNPTGSYHRYVFSFAKMNDYPKFGVWHDGYYMTINQFAAGSLAWAGGGVVAFERDKMLSGQSARMVYFDLFSVDPNLGGMLPSDGDGASPPAGRPNYVMQFDDNPDQMQIWALTTNWTTPAASTFTKVTNLALPALDSGISCGASQRDCIPQPNTIEKLDALNDRLMYRLQYRNFGTHETFVTNHTVDVDGTNHAGVRWYEIRRTNNAFSLQQAGTYAPDAHHRWMGSAAMDQAGGIAVAYNVSSSTVFPSVRYTGRAAGSTAAPGVLDQGEADIIVGSGSQTHTASRWGDYSNVSVDPVDGCTFWATLEYMPSTSPAGWRTRIAAFKLPGCGTTGSPPGSPSPLTAAATSAPRVDLNWTNASGETGYLVRRCTGSGCTPTPADTIASPPADATTYIDTGVVFGTTYVYQVIATNSVGSTSSNTAEVTTPGGGGGTTLTAPTNLKATALRSSGVRLTWTDNATGETRFEILRSGGAGTVTITVNQANVTAYTDTSAAPKTNYTYQVRACDATSCSAYSNTSQVRTR